jgi:hypothetical protein
MNEGMPLRALAWGLMTALVLLAWPWILAWFKMRRPRVLVGIEAPDIADLEDLLHGPGLPNAHGRRYAMIGNLRGGTLLMWIALAATASLIPMGNGWLAADLDAGLLWVAMLAFAATAGLHMSDPRSTIAAAGGLLTIFLCVTPLAMHTAGLHLGDLAMAQQGGAGNWFLVRDPFLLISGIVYLLAVAALWPAWRPPLTDRRGTVGLDGMLMISACAGLPLVLAHLFTVAYLGGWWSFMPALDGLSWAQTILKNMVVWAAVLWLRRHPAWCSSGNLVWRLPLAAMISSLGAVFWLVLSGAVL